MGLKSLMQYLQKPVTDTPDTSEKSMGYQCKAPIHAGCTPDTPDTSCFVDTRINAQFAQFGEAVNDPASTQPPDLVQPPNPAPEPPTDPNAWRELAAAYHQHHFKCPVCIAAGRGAGYGLRCGTGAALWTSYSDTTEQPANKGRP